MEIFINESHRYTSEVHKDFFVGWPVKPALSTLIKHFEGSENIFAIVDENVIGFVTALTDKALYGFVALLEVRWDYQHRGIGSSLVIAMEEHLGSIYALDLSCDAELVSFYESLGFTKSQAMIKRKRAALEISS